jgi:two-component response regulator (ARR-B family)
LWAAQRRDSDDTGAAKKPRVVWSAEMHQQFVEAVERLGVDSARPARLPQRVCP